MDVKETFIHGYLEKIIYMNQPEGFTIKGKEKLFYMVKKYLYGLKWSPRMWYHNFDSYIQGLGLKRIYVDHYVYRKHTRDHLIYVALYVDDMLLVGNNMNLIKEVKNQLSPKFDMKYIGPTLFILGMKIKRDRENKRV